MHLLLQGESAQWEELILITRRTTPSPAPVSMLRASSRIACLHIYDGTGNPAALLTDFYSTSYSYTYDPYGLPTLTGGGTGQGFTHNPNMFKGDTQDRATGFVEFGG